MPFAAAPRSREAGYSARSERGPQAFPTAATVFPWQATRKSRAPWISIPRRTIWTTRCRPYKRLEQLVGGAQPVAHDLHHLQREDRILPDQEFEARPVDLDKGALGDAQHAGAAGQGVDEGHLPDDGAWARGFDEHVVHHDLGFALKQHVKVDAGFALLEKGFA